MSSNKTIRKQQYLYDMEKFLSDEAWSNEESKMIAQTCSVLLSQNENDKLYIDTLMEAIHKLQAQLAEKENENLQLHGILNEQIEKIVCDIKSLKKSCLQLATVVIGSDTDNCFNNLSTIIDDLENKICTNGLFNFTNDDQTNENVSNQQKTNEFTSSSSLSNQQKTNEVRIIEEIYKTNEVNQEKTNEVEALNQLLRQEKHKTSELKLELKQLINEKLKLEQELESFYHISDESITTAAEEGDDEDIPVFGDETIDFFCTKYKEVIGEKKNSLRDEFELCRGRKSDEELSSESGKGSTLVPVSSQTINTIDASVQTDRNYLCIIENRNDSTRNEPNRKKSKFYKILQLFRKRRDKYFVTSEHCIQTEKLNVEYSNIHEIHENKEQILSVIKNIPKITRSPGKMNEKQEASNQKLSSEYTEILSTTDSEFSIENDEKSENKSLLRKFLKKKKDKKSILEFDYLKQSESKKSKVKLLSVFKKSKNSSNTDEIEIF